MGNTVPESGQRKRGGGPIRAGAALLSFLLGILLVMKVLFYVWSGLSFDHSRQWLMDCRQSDYQNTYNFRQEIAAQLEVLMAMGAGEVLDYIGHLGETAQIQAETLHRYMKGDRNLLYTIMRDGAVVYTNHKELTRLSTPKALAEQGYNFMLQFDGNKVRIWKDNVECDIYKDRYYDFDNREQWYVPGYENLKVSPSRANVQVIMAVIREPKVFMENKENRHYDRIYGVHRELMDWRRQVGTQLALLAAGVVLLLIAGGLHRDKVRADLALARLTGKIWFEGKLLLLLIPLVALYLQCSPTAALRNGSVVSVETVDTMIQAENGTTLYTGQWPEHYTVTEMLMQIPEHGQTCMLLFLVWYVFGVNDWRRKARPWRHGICSMLAARQLKLPIQQRMSRTAGWLCAALGVLLMELGYLYLAMVTNDTLPIWWHGLILVPSAAAIGLFIWGIVRQNSIWTGLGTLSDQIAAVRAGDMEHPISLPEQHDLYRTAEDLNHIQQGVHQAVEERIQSERMKVELITNVSHDLKTPLTSIISYTELLEQEQLDPPAGEYVAILCQKAQRLKAMVQDVFEVSKAASGQLPVKLERLDLVRLLRQTLADQDEAIRASGLLLRLNIPESPIYIMADSERMYRVYQNLIVNVLRYSLDSSRVYLTVEQHDGRVDTILQNTSAAELKPKTDYLGRFVRGDESRTDGGSGLGLSIASSFTQVCGGSLEIETQADLFTVRVSFPVDI